MFRSTGVRNRCRFGWTSLARVAEASPAKTDSNPSRDCALAENAAGSKGGTGRGSVRFGTSSWTYPGWTGLVYSKAYPKTGASAAMLAEYARYPHFGTVGIDSSFYRPPEPEVLHSYAAALPPGFPCVSKVWDRLTIHTWGRAEKGGTPGERNPHFLDAELFVATMLEPYLSHFADHMGPFVFELQAIPRSARVAPAAFADLLDRFFARLPRDARYAVELRNAEYLTPAYFAVLREHDVAHCFNSWTHMPSVGEQLDLDGSLTTSFTVCRALMRPGRTYADSRAVFEPFDGIREPQPEVRADIVRLAKATLGIDGDAYVLINNRLEGCAPETIRALAAALAPEAT